MRIRLSDLRRIIREEVEKVVEIGPGLPSRYHPRAPDSDLESSSRRAATGPDPAARSSTEPATSVAADLAAAVPELSKLSPEAAEKMILKMLAAHPRTRGLVKK